MVQEAIYVLLLMKHLLYMSPHYGKARVLRDKDPHVSHLLSSILHGNIVAGPFSRAIGRTLWELLIGLRVKGVQEKIKQSMCK